VLTTTATEIHTRLRELEAKRMLASLQGLTNDPAYLTAELTAARQAYVGAAVTEIASLRAALSGPLLG